MPVRRKHVINLLSYQVFWLKKYPDVYVGSVCVCVKVGVSYFRPVEWRHGDMNTLVGSVICLVPSST